MDQVQLETESKAIFSRVEKAVPPPFLAGRVLARALERKRTSLEVVVLRWVAGLSFVAVLGLVTHLQMNKSAGKEILFASQPYVIHVDLNDAELKLAQSAEVELPEGVSFVSKNKVVKELRRLKLPVSQVKEGRSRLPFVVLSDREGTMPLQVRIYDENDELIQTRTLTLHFAKGQG